MRVAPTYESSRGVYTIETADAPPFTPKPSKMRPPWDETRGDPNAAAPVKIAETYTTPIENHNPMETHGTVALWQDDKLTLYDATQGIFGVKKRIAEIFGIAPDDVRVVSHFVGGGFGSKGSPWSHVVLAAMAARVVRRPVKLVVTRHQMFSFVGHRPRTIQRLAIGAKRDGTLVSIAHDVVTHTSRFDDFVEPSALATRMLYACPNVRTSHKLVRLDLPTPTFMRAPGESTGSFALESALDEVAYACDVDPVALRMTNYAKSDPDEEKPWSSKSLDQCYRAAADRFGWSKRTRAPRSMRDGRVLVGQGMATATYPSRQWPASALAKMRADGTAVVVAGTQDIGTGTYTIMTQIAADALGLDVAKVRFDLGDTSYPETPVSGGSSTASSTGSAVSRASLALRDRIAEIAIADSHSPLFGLRAADLDAQNGTLVSKTNPSKSDDYVSILKRANRDEVEARVESKEMPGRKDHSCHAFGAHFVEVRVDEALHEVRVSRVVSAFASGKILNAKTARSQYIGGIVWGIGLALLEHTVRDERDGRVVTRDFSDYHVPTNRDVPDIDVIFVDETDPYVNAIGAKGIGEIGIVGMGAAIANAVHHATGVRVRDLPITLDKLMSPSGGAR